MGEMSLMNKIWNRLKHRGPDWSGIYQHGDCYLAHQRLAIIDPASGDQPLFNEDKSIVVTVWICFSLFNALSYFPFYIICQWVFEGEQHVFVIR